MAVAGLPLIIAGVAIAIARPDALPDGDIAVDEIALLRSEHFAQLVGNYSRFGWSHPGPGWFYAVDVFYAPLGSQTFGFYVGVLLLHAIFALLLVALVWRVRGALAAAVAAVLVLVYLDVISASVWRTVWPPFAPVLPMALLFPLAAWGAVRSLPAFVGALVVGSYALQSHIGTTLTVLSVWGVMTALRVLWTVWDRRAGRREIWGLGEGGGGILLVGVGLVLLVALWAPVAADEISGTHNVSQLIAFFHTPQGQHGWRESLSAVATMLGSFTSGYVPPLQRSTWLPVPASAWITGAAYLAVLGALLITATAVRDRFVQALAVLLGVAFPVLLVSVRHAAGDIYPYFLLWMTVMPLLAAIGWAALVAGRADRLVAAGHLRQAAALAAALVLLAPAAYLSARLTDDLQRQPSVAGVQFDSSSRAAWELTSASLRRLRRGTIVVTWPDHDRWPLAAGLVLQLVKAGWKVEVEPGWTPMFGADMRTNGSAAAELVVTDATLSPRASTAVAGMRLIGETPNTKLFLGDLYSGQSP